MQRIIEAKAIKRPPKPKRKNNRTRRGLRRPDRGNPMETRKVSYFSKQVLRKRARILNKLANLEKDLDNLQHNQPKDWAEVNNDTLERETIMQNIDAERENLQLVNEALRKMIEGGYGVCGGCGSRIPEARLRALPFAKLCIKCQVEKEHWAHLAV
jgi:DnaK suppressor protein